MRWNRTTEIRMRAALHTSKKISEVERLHLIVAKQEVEIARLKKDIGWKELVQTGNTLLAKERIRSNRRTENEISCGFFVPDHGAESFRLGKYEGAIK